MVTALRPERGGFVRPFGTAIFIHDFLSGEGGKYGAPTVAPGLGAPQQDIHAAYKGALHRAIAEDAAAWDAEEAIRADKPLTPEEVEARRDYYLARIPYKLTRMRYHSFLVYFGMLKRLGWVEPTGQVERSTAQEMMALKREGGISIETRAATTQDMLDAIQSLLDESRKAESLRKLEAALGKLTPAQRRSIEGLDELIRAIKDYKDIQRKGLTPEEYQEEKESAWSEIEDRLDNLSVEEEEVVPIAKPGRATGQPRIYYRLTDKGRAASLVELSNPLRVLYPHFTAEYFREARRSKGYFHRPSKPRSA